MHASGNVTDEELEELRQRSESERMSDDAVVEELDDDEYPPYQEEPEQEEDFSEVDFDLDETAFESEPEEFYDEEPAQSGYAYDEEPLDEELGQTEAWDAGGFDDVDFDEPAPRDDLDAYGEYVLEPYDGEGQLEPEPVEESSEPSGKKKRKGRKAAAVVLTVFGVAIVGGGLWGAKTILDMGATSTTEQVGDVTAAKSGKLGASDEDVAMLKPYGYDAQMLATRSQEFCTAFFTFTPATIKDGSWEKAYTKYTADLKDISVSTNENMIATRAKDDWKKMTESHPGFEGKVIGYESLAFGLSEDKLPYCDIVAVVSRPELDRYTTNSPALLIDKALDTYRVVFDKDGDVTSVRRLQFRVLEQDSDEALAAADARAVEKSAADQKKAAEEAKKKEEEEKKKAEEEEKAKKEAEEKQKAEEEEKKAEEEAAKKKAAEEAAAKEAAETEAARKAEEEAAKKKAEEEEAARKKAEEEAAKKKAEEEAAAARNANEATA